jgi:hypothetical protein
MKDLSVSSVYSVVPVLAANRKPQQMLVTLPRNVWDMPETQAESAQ